MKNMDLTEVINRIGYFRNRANLSARALSLEIGKNPAYITKLEAREYEPSMQIMLDIIDACNTTVEEFFYKDITSYKIDKDALKIIERLNPKQKSALIELLE